MLGSILFSINDIHNLLDKIIIKLFADDTNCFVYGNDFNLLERLAETELNKLQKWINANKLTINGSINVKLLYFQTKKQVLAGKF